MNCEKFLEKAIELKPTCALPLVVKSKMIYYIASHLFSISHEKYFEQINLYLENSLQHLQTAKKLLETDHSTSETISPFKLPLLLGKTLLLSHYLSFLRLNQSNINLTEVFNNQISKFNEDSKIIGRNLNDFLINDNKFEKLLANSPLLLLNNTNQKSDTELEISVIISICLKVGEHSVAFTQCIVDYCNTKKINNFRISKSNSYLIPSLKSHFGSSYRKIHFKKLFIDLDNYFVIDESLIANFHQIEELAITQLLTDPLQFISAFKLLRHLKTIKLSNISNLSSDNYTQLFTNLKSCHQMQNISLENLTHFSDENLDVILSQFQQTIQTLSINNINITDQSLAIIAKYSPPLLSIINFSDIQNEFKDIEPLSNIKSPLVKIYLPKSSNFSFTSLASLYIQLPNIEELKANIHHIFFQPAATFSISNFANQLLKIHYGGNFIHYGTKVMRGVTTICETKLANNQTLFTSTVSMNGIATNYVLTCPFRKGNSEFLRFTILTSGMIVSFYSL